LLIDVPIGCKKLHKEEKMKKIMYIAAFGFVWLSGSLAYAESDCEANCRAAYPNAPQNCIRDECWNPDRGPR
jgi:hypothetical protein